MSEAVLDVKEGEEETRGRSDPPDDDFMMGAKLKGSRKETIAVSLSLDRDLKLQH